MGGGAQGMAIAYKLAKLKYGKDIVVLDQVYYNRSQYLYIFINIFFRIFLTSMSLLLCICFFNRVKLEEALLGTLLV